MVKWKGGQALSESKLRKSNKIRLTCEWIVDAYIYKEYDAERFEMRDISTLFYLRNETLKFRGVDL